MERYVFHAPTVDSDGYVDATNPQYKPVVAQGECGVRLILGSEDPESQAPDLFIERRKGGWAITVHALGQEDPSGYVYILDDGRSAAAPEMAWGNTPAMAMLDAHEHPEELDGDSANAQV